MTEQTSDPSRFFDQYPRFVDTSETGPWIDRLNARYVALIHSNRALLQDASVLDLASHDGRFTFAALQNGARHVVGIERDEHLVRKCQENMELYDVAPERYDILHGNIFDRIDEIERCDVVMCFGIFYHINNHMLLLHKIAALEPRALILDTNISHLQETVIELLNPPGVSPIEGLPSKSGLEAMVSNFGWTMDYFDWAGSAPIESERLHDYRTGGRVTALVKCDEISAEVRARAVQTVVDRLGGNRYREGAVITEVAQQFGMTPQALSVWVRHDERLRSLQSE